MKGEPIKPGTLCVVVYDGVNNGAFVTAVRRRPEYDHEFESEAWEVTNCSRPLIACTGETMPVDRAAVSRRVLKPISDPDADVTETNEKELMV